MDASLNGLTVILAPFEQQTSLLFPLHESQKETAPLYEQNKGETPKTKMQFEDYFLLMPRLPKLPIPFE